MSTYGATGRGGEGRAEDARGERRAAEEKDRRGRERRRRRRLRERPSDARRKTSPGNTACFQHSKWHFPWREENTRRALSLRGGVLRTVSRCAVSGTWRCLGTSARHVSCDVWARRERSRLCLEPDCAGLQETPASSLAFSRENLPQKPQQTENRRAHWPPLPRVILKGISSRLKPKPDNLHRAKWYFTAFKRVSHRSS